MAGVDEIREILRRAEPAGRRVHSGRLVAPRAVERMLRDRHQLDVGEAHVGDVIRQLLGELAIGQPAAAVFGLPPPRAEMHLVDRHRRRQRVGLVLQPRNRRQLCRIDHDRRGRRPLLGAERHRIGLQRQQCAVRADDLVLVFVAGMRARHEDFPVAVAAHPHGVAAAVPMVEVADHADAPRVRREHHEGHALDILVPGRMRAELVVELEMRAFAEQMQVHVGQDRRKAVGVLHLDFVVAEPRPQTIMRIARRHRPGEQSGVMDAWQIADVAFAVQHLHLGCLGQEHPHHRLAVLVVPAEIVERVVVMTLDDRARGLGNAHASTGLGGTTLWRCRMRQVPSRGTCSQAGRFISSYSIS